MRNSARLSNIQELGEHVIVITQTNSSTCPTAKGYVVADGRGSTHPLPRAAEMSLGQERLASVAASSRETWGLELGRAMSAHVGGDWSW